VIVQKEIPPRPLSTSRQAKACTTSKARSPGKWRLSLNSISFWAACWRRLGTALVGLVGIAFACAGLSLSAGPPALGEAPQWPEPRGLVRSLAAASASNALDGLHVDITNRSEVSNFFYTIYPQSEAVAMQWNGNTGHCIPGDTSEEFKNAVALRINFFRAMAGLPANVVLSPDYNRQSQAAALMMSAAGQLSHAPSSTWPCYTAEGAQAAAVCNIALDMSGPTAINEYMHEYGNSNFQVGHRRWLLYPQTQMMGTGDVEAQDMHQAANAVWVVDGQYGGVRPATRTEFVSWPPAGYVPYAVVYPRWSFSLPGAGFRNASVSITSNGVPIQVRLEPVSNGYGESTLVWIPGNADQYSYWNPWPKPAADTTYAVAVSNVISGGVTRNFNYQVTIFDPEQPGPEIQIVATEYYVEGQMLEIEFTVNRYVEGMPFYLEKCDRLQGTWGVEEFSFLWVMEPGRRYLFAAYPETDAALFYRVRSW
jgi:hypothetical protein